MIEEDVTVYRSARAFPPDESEYVPAANQPGRVIRGRTHSKRASRGLSVFTTAQAVDMNLKRFPKLGSYIVRYHIPRGCTLTLMHLVGIPEHLTILGDDMLELATYLDESWWRHVSSAAEGGDEHHG